MEVIELSSDSEQEVSATKAVVPERTSRSPSLDRLETPFFKAPGIVYKDDDANNQEGEKFEQPKDKQEPISQSTESDDKSLSRKHVCIEIPLPTSSELQQRKVEAAAEKTEESSKTSADRRHITFDDSESEQFITLKEEAASRNGLGNGSKKSEREIVQDSQDEEEDSEESDDDAPPEEVATGEAEAALLKAERAAAKAAEQ
jgi:hypothetical protein